MIPWIASALAGPAVVVTFDNGGFNLPLYTPRWNGAFSQPSVAQQLAADIARVEPGVRVFTYLPPGATRGRSSDPFEVLPLRPGCARPAGGERPAADSPCACPAGDRCWTELDVSRDPAASTSLFQAASAVRSRVPAPRVEVHVTDLFEEDPSAAENPADADRCVTAESTRKAVEALLAPGSGSLDHAAVGLLTAKVDAPRAAAGGLTAFAEAEGGCWTAHRLRTFGPGGAPTEIAMAVVVLGIDTAGADDAVRAVIEGMERQVSAPLSLDLVMVREPALTVDAPASAITVDQPVPLPDLPARSTPCAAMAASLALGTGSDAVQGAVAPGPTCDASATLRVDAQDVRAAWRRVAGLDPRVDGVDLRGSVTLTGDSASVRDAAIGLPAHHPVADRPLVFWGALVQALRLEEPRGVWRPRTVTVRLPGVRVNGLDDRPWRLSAGLGLLMAFCVLGFSYALIGRIVAERAFRRHLGAAAPGRPIAAVLAEAQEAARGGVLGRLSASVVLGALSGIGVAFAILWSHGVGRG